MEKQEAIAYGNDYYRDLISACCEIDEKHKEFVRMSLEALKQEPCEDAISRAEANKLVDELARAIDDQNRHYPKRGRDIAIIAMDIERLPRVTPIREHGEWTDIVDGISYTWATCNKCNGRASMAYKYYKFCPNCGADMRKEQK